jgi:2-polyprenyl-6-hydroxyphenyl methylase/3-demethylubiquinone-9 3-methyltransferase
MVYLSGRSDFKTRRNNCAAQPWTALEAARFYAATFSDSKVTAVHNAPGDYPSGKEGDVLTVEFTSTNTVPSPG